MKRLRIVVLTVVALALASVGVVARARSHHGHHHQHERHEQVTARQIVLLTPGTGFDFGSSFDAQVGESHYQYWKKLRDQGKIELAGFFDGAKGELIVGAPGVGEAEMTRLANADPAVKDLIATPEVRRLRVSLGPKAQGPHDELDDLQQ